jgi:type II secretory pathway pseudopilin PulG
VRRGITFIELIVVLALVGMIGAVSFPAVSSGIDSVRLSGAADSIVTFLNAGLNRAERRQVPVEIFVTITENKVKMLSMDTTRELEMPQNIRITRIHPTPFSGVDDQERSIVLYPGGAIPRFGIEIAGPKGARRIVRVDPITGVPDVEVVQ